MNQSKKLLAALVAVPVSVVVADSALAAENEITATQTFEIKNEFIGNTTYTTQPSSKSIPLNKKTDLESQIQYEMANFTNGFTITYSGDDVADYQKTIEETLSGIKDYLNTTVQISTADSKSATIDKTILYGTFNNMRVKATETLEDGAIKSVKLEFSVNYFGSQKDIELIQTKYEITSLSTAPIQQVKAVHDFIIQNTKYTSTNSNFSTLLTGNGGSSHSYAFWTYLLLKKLDPNFPIKYVHGIANGEYRSWNIVQINNKWYNLDVAGDDFETAKDSQTINYCYFLTYTPNERRITSPSIDSASTETTYNYFKTIDNLAQSGDALYYADAASNGEIFKLQLTDLTSTTLNIEKSDASTGTGKMVYYQQPSNNATPAIEYLYFINDSQGGYLYRYQLNGTATERLTLLVKEQVESITLKGSSLSYTFDGGKSDYLPLNSLVALDDELAKKVINAIKGIENTAVTLKTDVKNAREQYMALTLEQQQIVKNTFIDGIDMYNQLLNYEAEIGGNDTKLSNAIKLINELDPLNPSYVADVEAAQLAAQGYGTALYNYSILQSAVAKITKAKSLANDLKLRIEKIENEANTDPFNQYNDFIPFIENVLKEYDRLLPSIQKVFTNTAQFDTYRQLAVDLRTEVQSFVNEVKIVDENAANFFKLMDELVLRQNHFVKSQKALISSEQTTVANKVKLYNEMKQQVEQFKETMFIINSSTDPTIALTPDLIAKVKAAKEQFDQLKPAQKQELTTEEELLNTIVSRINNLTDNTKFKAVETLLSEWSISSLTSLDDLATSFETIENAIVDLKKEPDFASNEQVLNLLSVKAKANYDEIQRLNKLIGAVKTLRNEMNALTSSSTPEMIDDLRTRYNALDSAFVQFFTAEEAKLVAEEERLQNEANEATVKALIADIDKLTSVSSLEEIVKIKDRYDSLPSTLQADVTNKEHLLEIYQQVKTEVEAYQKAIDDINKAIANLSDKSTRKEIEAVMEAYDKLTDDQKAKIIDYDLIEELLAQLDVKDQEALDQAAADKVIALINKLGPESLPAEIKSARDAYEELTDEAKELVPENSLKLLVYYEEEMALQEEQAKKEAAVVFDRIERINNSYTETQIKSIRMAFNALSELAKTYITNLQKLIDAENNIIYQNTVVKQAKLDANAFDVYMNDINRNSTTAEIAKARAYYNRLSGEAKKHVTTYEKLVRLETMWKDPKYLDLVFTYYPEYVNAVKPGAIVIEKPSYDPLYIPDDSTPTPSSTPVVAANPVTSWSPYESMRYQNGRYTTTISATQVNHVMDRNMRLKADDIEIVIPTLDLRAATAAVGVSVTTTNNQLNIQFTEGAQAKVFSEYVEIHVPFSVLKGNASQIIERVTAAGSSATSFKVDGSTFIIRTKTGGTFKAATASTYSDIPGGAQGTAIRELAKRGIQFNTTSRLSQSYRDVTKMDVALMIATALDISSNQKSKYQDLESEAHTKRAQGLLEAGIMSGATSANFNANGTVTKQEAAIIIANMYRYLNQDLAKAYNNLTSNYRDVAGLTLEARQSIAILELFGVVSGTGAFEPTQPLTRGEFAELIYKALTAVDYL